MDLLSLLKKFKNIQADPSFVAETRRALLESPFPARRPSTWQILAQSLEFGSAIVLAGLLLVAVLGGVSAWRFLSPLKMDGLDPTALQAEAQAVDMQLELTRIHYSESASAGAGAAGPKAASQEPATTAHKTAEKQAQTMGLAPATSSPEPNIDETLDLLSE